MKHYYRGLSIAVLTSYAAIFSPYLHTHATTNLWTRMSVIGKLDNGLTYYIRHNPLR